VLLPGQRLLRRCQAAEVLSVEVEQNALVLNRNCTLCTVAHLEDVDIEIVGLRHNLCPLRERGGGGNALLRIVGKIRLQGAVLEVLEPHILHLGVIAAHLAHSGVEIRAHLPAAPGRHVTNNRTLAEQTLELLDVRQQHGQTVRSRARIKAPRRRKSVRRRHRAVDERGRVDAADLYAVQRGR